MTAVESLVSRISVLIPEDIGSQLMFKSNVDKALKLELERIEEASIKFAEYMLDYDPTMLYKKTKKELFQEFLNTKT